MHNDLKELLISFKLYVYIYIHAKIKYLRSDVRLTRSFSSPKRDEKSIVGPILFLLNFQDEPLLFSLPLRSQSQQFKQRGILAFYLSSDRRWSSHPP